MAESQTPWNYHPGQETELCQEHLQTWGICRCAFILERKEPDYSGSPRQNQIQGGIAVADSFSPAVVSRS